MIGFLKDLPHRTAVLAFGGACLAIIGVIEATSLSIVIFEEGFIHMLAIAFSGIGLAILASPDHTSDGSFRLFSRYAAASLVTLGVAHVVEYLGETRGMFNHNLAHEVVAVCYVAAFLLLALGTLVTMRRSGIRATSAWYAITIIAVAQVTEVLQVSLLHDWHELLIISAGTLAIYEIGILAAMMPVVNKVAAHFQIAVVLVTCSYPFGLVEVTLARVGMPEHRIENLLHYFFYAGLIFFFLSFDFFRHFGGIYADIRKEMGE